MGSRRYALIAAVLCSTLASMSWAGCAEDRIDLRGNWGQAQFRIDVADDGAERSRGLMFVPSMPRFSGMLFVYDQEQTVGFWMENTLIPLDMIFADGRGVVQKVHANAVPGDRTTIFGGRNIQYVLEINGGMASMLGIGPGSQMRHPAIDAAVWPCE